MYTCTWDMYMDMCVHVHVVHGNVHVHVHVGRGGDSVAAVAGGTARACAYTCARRMHPAEQRGNETPRSMSGINAGERAARRCRRVTRKRSCSRGPRRNRPSARLCASARLRLVLVAGHSSSKLLPTGLSQRSGHNGRQNTLAWCSVTATWQPCTRRACNKASASLSARLCALPCSSGCSALLCALAC